TSAAAGFTLHADTVAAGGVYATPGTAAFTFAADTVVGSSMPSTSSTASASITFARDVVSGVGSFGRAPISIAVAAADTVYFKKRARGLGGIPALHAVLDTPGTVARCSRASSTAWRLAGWHWERSSRVRCSARSWLRSSSWW